MNRFYRIIQRQRSRVIAVGVGVLLLLTSSALALSVTNAKVGVTEAKKKLETGATYEIVIPASGGSEVVTWAVGRATVRASAIYTPGDCFGGGRVIRVQNDGPYPIGVMQNSEVSWIDPGGEGGLGGKGCIYFPSSGEGSLRVAEMFPIAILDEGGVVATGTFAWTFWYNAADRTGHYVYTLKMEGNEFN